ncbi:MAG: substrate-binding domain-containing protein [Actinobacteria bacterium]|nr:substrate-binding domain-containing protein [Actinomycetota bacterium]
MKRYVKITVIAALCLAMVITLSFIGCKKEEAEEGGMQVKTFENAGDITIGFSVWTMEFTFFQNVEKGVKDACEDLGFKYVMIDQNSDATKMVQDLNSFVGQGVSGIVVTPVDPGAIGPAVENARMAGIPVVCADIGKSGPVNALMISNNFKGGELAAEFLASKINDTSKPLGLGNLLPQWTYARQRGEGFLSKALELGYNVAANIIVQNPSAEGGYDTMQQILSAVPDVAGVYFTSGREAVGAAQAIQAAGKDIWSVGYNGDPEEFQAIKDGVLDATILQEPYYIGYRSVEILKEILLDGKFYENVEVPVDVKLITPENIDDIAAEILEKTGNSAFPAE